MTARPMLPTVAMARAQRLALPVGDADTLIALELLCGHRRGERWEQAPTTKTASATLALALARTSGVGVLRFLVEQGAERDDDVLIAGKRVPVALSRQHTPPISLVTSNAWPDFLWQLSTTILPLAQRRREGGHSDLVGLGRTERQHLRLALPASWSSSSSSITVGDQLCFAMAGEHVVRLGLPDSLEVLVRRALASTSPLCALWQLDDPELGDVDLATLLSSPLVEAMTLCLPGIARAWLRRLDHLLRRSADADALVAHARALSSRLRTLLALLDSHERLDLAGVFVDLAAGLPAVVVADTRERLVRVAGVFSMADRDRVIAAVLGIFDVVDDLVAVGQRVAATRYGDERWAEAAFVRAWLGRLTSSRAAIDEARHQLSGAVG
ncbi:MAG TPA: hypothetical protein VGF99_04370 [Myxococcota bacterium]